MRDGLPASKNRRSYSEYFEDGDAGLSGRPLHCGTHEALVGSVFQPLKLASIDYSFVLLRRREICPRKKRPGNKGAGVCLTADLIKMDPGAGFPKWIMHDNVTFVRSKCG
jgi:hypothetical protein